METNDRASQMDRENGAPDPDLGEIVMGLHWDPPREGEDLNPANLDALCVLLDEGGRVLEVVHPGRPQNDNGSVIHTGDSKTGASEWDDERIFVFLKALPEEVFAVAFVVVSASGRALDGIRGATCHVSDRIFEREWVRHELAGLRGQTVHCVAAVRRGPGGWTISSRAEDVDERRAEWSSAVDAAMREGGLKK